MTPEQSHVAAGVGVPEPAAGAGASRAMIEARGLSRFYGPFVAIQDISFDIPEGQIAAFLGPNGAGKSTTMKILTGYLAPSAGEATVAGLDIRTRRLEAARSLGYLPENGPLYPEMTPAELLQFFGEARGLAPERLRERIAAVKVLCDLELVLEKPIGKLSKGLRQRVGLAQALLHDPEVLIMDEPTAGLDPNQIRDFRRNLQELRRNKGKTILLSTHILQEVEALADRILFLSRGRLVFDGSIDEARRRGGSLERLFHDLTAEDAGPDAGAAAGGPPTSEPPAAAASEGVRS
jgi:ABC-2 type transport system ATP-binding protein